MKGEPDTRSSTPRSAIKTHIVVVLHATLGRLEAPGHQRPLEPFEGTACNQIPFSALWGAEAYRGNEESCMDCQEDLGSEGVPDTRSVTPSSAIKTHIVVVLHATLGRLEAPGHPKVCIVKACTF